MANNETTIRIPEIVAPAGSPDGFAAALKAGADAVYAGVYGFNMRAGAEPLDMARITDMTSRAHDAGVRLFMAMNTIAYDDETGEAARILDAAARSGVDAVILWDMGLLELARERCLPIHLSTQASVANTRAAAFYEAHGVKRIVLARELSLERLGSVVRQSRERNSSLEFEVFVHGAMCVAVSGRCLTSQFLSGRSANRGDCLQPCRRSYRITDTVNENELVLDGHTVLSARDLCTIGIMDRIIAAGVHALKIEGRMRDALYVRTTVECYREARDAVLAGRFDASVAESLTERLSRVFHRGFSTGFYLDRPDFDIDGGEGNKASVVRQYAGRVFNYYPKAKAADIQLEARGLSRGDTVLITGPTTGAVEFVAGSLRSERNEPLDDAAQGRLIGLATPEKVRENDAVYVLIPRDAE